MKRITAIISLAVALFAGGGLNLSAQTDYRDFIPLAVVSSAQSGLSASTQTYIENKLLQVVTQNGLGSGDYFNRFLITASVMPVTKDIVAGPPTKFSENIDVTFYIVDNIDRKIFSSVTVSAKAVEASEEKALNMAIRSVSTNSKAINGFVKTGLDKIIVYYRTQADQIIATAKSLAAQKMYEQAFYELCAIPRACGSAYTRALEAGNQIYKDYVNYMGEVNLAKAKAAWAPTQNRSGAEEAGLYLSQILPEAKCYSQAQALYKEIKAKVKEDWKFEMKIYQDGVDLEKRTINAWRDVGVAYGRGQQPTTYNTNWIVR